MLDRETGLVWERRPEHTCQQYFRQCRLALHRPNVGNRLGWRSPTIRSCRAWWIFLRQERQVRVCRRAILLSVYMAHSGPQQRFRLRLYPRRRTCGRLQCADTGPLVHLFRQLTSSYGVYATQISSKIGVYAEGKESISFSSTSSHALGGPLARLAAPEGQVLDPPSPTVIRSALRGTSTGQLLLLAWMPAMPGAQTQLERRKNHRPKGQHICTGHSFTRLPT